MSSYRQQIADAIQARLETILPGKVFNLPSGAYTCTSTISTAYQWRKTVFSKADLPGVCFRDEDADVVPGPVGIHESHMKIALEAIMAPSTLATTARAMLADIVAAIGSDPRWGGLAYWTDIHSHSIDLDQAGDAIPACQVLFTVTYRTPLWQM